MKTIREILRAEFISGRNTFDWVFLCMGLSVQVVVFLLEPQEPVAIVSGMAGIISVILCSQGKISTFFFGFIQISTYLYLCLCQHLYAEVGMNIFYFLSQIYGIYVWIRRYRTPQKQEQRLAARKMSPLLFIVIFGISLIASVAVGYLLAHYTNDSQPYLDAFTTVPAIFAQVMLVMAYREQYIIWFTIDILSIVMWYRAGNLCLTMQYAFWCINCLYGFKRWTETT